MFAGGTCPGHWVSRYGSKWPSVCWCATATRSCPPHWLYLQIPVMCSETVGLRTKTAETKKSILVLQVWCCVVKHNLVTFVVIMILKDTTTFQVLFIVSLFCIWNITTVEINSGVHLVKVNSAKCLCLLPVVLVLVLLFWPWCTGVGSGGMQWIWHPNYICGDIDMYIP